MRRTITLMTAAALALTAGCKTQETERSAKNADAPMTQPAGGGMLTPAQVADRAGEFDAALTLPTLETSAAQIAAATEQALTDADRRLDRIASQDPERVTFRSTIRALDDVDFEVGKTLNRFFLMQETQQDEALRDAARTATVDIQNWMTETQYRVDLYEICNAYAQRIAADQIDEPAGEDRMLFEDTMRDYRRAGMNLDAATRERVEALRKELTGIETEFSKNNSTADVSLTFTRAELAGVPESALDQWANGDGTCTVKATVTPQFVTVMSNADSEATRERMKVARYTVNQETNSKLLNDMVRIRDEMAQLLGYGSWADYQTEPRMAGTGQTAESFVEDLAEGLDPKFQEELATFASMKRRDTGDEGAEVRIWDWRYYSNKLKREAYSVDVEALRRYFPLERVIDGAFEVYGEVFGLDFRQVSIPQRWDPSLTLWLCSDAESGKPLGLMYLDPYPRPNKYGHYAQFPIIPGKELADGTYQRPVCALVCNFPEPSGDTPSLLSFAEVETYFHELGHALHTMLTTASHARYSGTGVPRDFVEAPSQMLENWVGDPKVLARFAADYRDPEEKVPAEVLDKMEAAEKATIATVYRRQTALALGDLRVHKAGRYKDVGEIVNDTFGEYFLAVPEGTNFSAYWGHLAGYDAGYYGYSWADAIAADMATIFEDAPGGYMDKEIGMRLRNEIYSVGGSRPIDESVRRFLGRERSINAFLEDLGIQED